MAEKETSLIAHDTESFMLAFYEEYRRFVFKQSWYYSSEEIDVEDLVQEVWVRLCTKGELLSTYTKAQQFSYITATVRNTAISIVRKKTNEYPLEFIDSISYDEADMLQEIFARSFQIDTFRKVWPLVPAPSRELLERKYMFEESDEEIAQMMGISSNSVRMYLTRARKKAFSILAKYKDSLI